MRVGVLEGEETGAEEIFETVMTENFPKLMSDTKPQLQEAQKTTSRIKAKTNKQSTPWGNVFKIQKIEDKGKILEEARGGKTPYL